MVAYTDSFFGQTNKTQGVPQTEPQTDAGVTDTRYQQPRNSSADIGQNDIGNSKETNQSGRGNVIGGDSSARTAMGGGGSSGGGGGGGGGGGYSLGASVSGTQTSSAGFSGEIAANKGAGLFGGVFGADLIVNKGGTQTTGLTGTTLAIVGAAAIAGLGILYFVLRR